MNGYVVAAYGIALLAVVGYGLHLVQVRKALSDHRKSNNG